MQLLIKSLDNSVFQHITALLKIDGGWRAGGLEGWRVGAGGLEGGGLEGLEGLEGMRGWRGWRGGGLEGGWAEKLVG